MEAAGKIRSVYENFSDMPTLFRPVSIGIYFSRTFPSNWMTNLVNIDLLSTVFVVITKQSTQELAKRLGHALKLKAMS